MRIGVDTNDFSSARRLRTWRALMCETYVGMDCDPASDDFRAVTEGYRVGDYSITRGTTSGHYVDRSRSLIRRDNAERVFVAMTLAGRALMIQGGREANLEAGAFAFNDATRPFRTYLGGASDMMWLGLPKKALADRIRGLEDLTAVSFVPTRPVHRIAFELMAGLDDALGRDLPPCESDALVVRMLDLLAMTVVTSALVARSRTRSLPH